MFQAGARKWECKLNLCMKDKSTLLSEVCFEDGLGAVDVCACVLVDVCGSVHASYVCTRSCAHF